MNKHGAYWHLNKLLKSLAMAKKVTARLKKLTPHMAESAWDDKRIDIIIDVDTTGKVPAYVHELFHLYLDDKLPDFQGDVIETIVQALENELVNFLQQDKRRMNWWRKQVRGSL